MVVSVWRPGPNVSSALPSRKKTADWFSCTMSCAPIFMSAEPCGGKRETICCPVWSKNSMTSIAIWPPTLSLFKLDVAARDFEAERLAAVAEASRERAARHALLDGEAERVVGAYVARNRLGANFGIRAFGERRLYVALD